jgi:two-component system sensor histidine kinase ChiS
VLALNPRNQTLKFKQLSFKEKMKHIILVVSMILSFSVSAQQPINLKFSHLSISDGLSQSIVYSILQDSRGFMWFGTQDGLNKYDGYQFTVYRSNPNDSTSLSDNEVFVVFEDRNGTLWIGTGNGLNRFDREQQKFIRYYHDSENPNSLSNNTVWSIYEDDIGRLWIGTDGGGLNQFEPERETFVRYQHNPDNPNSLSHNSVWPIFQDRTGMLWIGTDGGGLNQFDIEQNKLTHYQPDAQNPESLSNFITSIYEDHTGILWIGTSGGLYRFDRQLQSFVHYFHDSDNPDTLSHNAVWALSEDSEGHLWIATDGGGLNLYDRKQDRFVHYQHDPKTPTSLSHDAILSIYQDRAGSIWVGTGGGGLNRFHPNQEKFVHYYNDPQNPNSLNANNILSIYQDREGLLWVGTEGGGLNRFDQKRQKVTHYLSDPQNPDSISHNDISAIVEESTGVLWIGTYGGGLNQLSQNKFVHYQSDPENPNSLSNNYILSIYEDSTETLWIGTRDGLNRFDRETGQFVHHSHDPKNPNSLTHNEIASIYEDKTGTLWFGTHEGLNRFDRQTDQFVRYQHNDIDPTTLSNNDITAIYEDKTGTLWIGTFGGGLNRFDRKTEHFYAYRETDGLANDTIYALLEDNQGYLWISTNKGLSKFNPNTKEFRNYDVFDGLQSNEFNAASRYKSPSGELFFGGINGFNAFYPEQVKDNPYIPPIVLTSFDIFNKPVDIGADSPLQQHINEANEITLSYQQSFFSFEFAALNFLQPEKNQYAYQLEGLDKDWNYIGTRRKAYYTNISHGTYVFRVKGSNNDGVWNEQGTALKITVLPPPWKTWWAYTLYVITVLVIILNYIRIQQQKLQKKQQELEREKQIAAQLREADRLKDEFLANTSHELRTPLNGIIGIAESLIDGATGQLSKATNANLNMIVSSGRRLLTLVNDILDFSKLKQKEIDLQLRAIDMRTIAELVLTLSQPLIGHKKLQLVNNIPADLPPINADENRIQQILYNLVGNAIKFTDSGTITVSAKIIHETDSMDGSDTADKTNDPLALSESQLAITVSDTGIGIPTEKLGRIFEAFEQAEGSTSRIYGGTGLGLAVTQQLVRLHGGQMGVESEVGVGSHFSFTLPFSDKKEKQAAKTQSSEQPPSSSVLVVNKPLSENEPQTEKLSVSDEPISEKTAPTDDELPIAEKDGQFHILIVDDEPVNRQVLVNHLLLQNYALTEATSGTEALDMIEKGLKPDLILLDVMMPKMTGYQVTRTIRETWKANELPIVLLTAKTQITDLVTGLEAGANDYLTKPVSKEELIARIKTHIGIQQLRAENLRMSAELDVTRRLQQMILPTKQEMSQVADLDIAGFMEPAEEIGGDYYDVLQHNGRILFGIGDVTGHGLESGVLMLMAQTAVRTLLENNQTNPVIFLNTLNKTIYKNTQQRMGVEKTLTLSLLEYSPTEGILGLSGQHEDIIVIRNDGRLELIDTFDLGFPIGLEEDITDFVSQAKIQLNPSEVVVLYTDGITEAENQDGKRYGIERLCEVVKNAWQQEAEKIRLAVIDDLRQFIGKREVLDDITLLVIKRK